MTPRYSPIPTCPVTLIGPAERPSYALEAEHSGRVAGVDEVGRGPLAGPVIAAAVIFERGVSPILAALLDDSKKLTAAQRNVAYAALFAADGVQIAVGAASVGEISRINILQAAFLAMHRAVARLPSPPDIALVDGNQPPRLPCPVRCIVGGDGLSLSIAAASIVAKVVRDRAMTRLGARFPHYGWHSNAGYSTPPHRAAIAAHGPCRHHRPTFGAVRLHLLATTDWRGFGTPARLPPLKPKGCRVEVVRELPLDQVLLGDCVRLMGMLPPASIHCVFADPPYNLQLRGELRRPDDSLVDGVDDDWDRFADFAEYDAFTRAWLEECRRLLRKDGTIWVIGAYHNIFRIGAILQDLGFWILNDVVWRKSNPMPNFRGRRFTNAHETLIWAARGRDSRYKFNYHAMKALNDDLQMRSDWLLPLCTGPERLRNQHGLKLHPTQKPEALLHRVLLASTAPDDIVLDPFLGSGTTAAVAKRLGRHFIGIERHPAYVEAAIGRVRRERPVPLAGLATAPSRRDQPRVSFGSFVETGVVAPGTELRDRTRKVVATVMADGTLASGPHTGSIHKVGAAVQNAPACNGWTFWHMHRDGKWQPIDVLRQALAPSPP